MGLNGLRVDLSAARAQPVQVSDELARRFLGGRGLGVCLLLRERAFELEPLAPQNPLVFAPGPLTGADAPAAGRYSLSSRSPLTGTVFDGNSGGTFGVGLRRLGLDFLIVSGACREPSVLELRRADCGRGREGGEECDAAMELTAPDAPVRVALRPAAELWGLDVPSTLAGLRQDEWDVAAIGPAGERGVLFASVVNDRGRQIGRGGLGAVMGAKLLKAVVVDGRGGALPGPSDHEAFERVVEAAKTTMREHPITARSLPDYGTSVLVNILDQAGVLPTRNFRDSRFEAAEEISGEALREGFVERRTSCRGCFIGCSRIARARGETGVAPEYETIWALGADCGVGDLEAIVHASFACNRAGLDTISMGGTIACAMELTERGLLDGGPRFGDAAAVLELVTATVEGRGLGSELALGSARFAARHGRPDLSMSVKRLELPAYDPRGMTGQGLAFATSNRGACHVRANMLGPELLGIPRLVDRFATVGKAGLLIRIQDLNAVLDSLSVCKFTAFAVGEEYYAGLLSAALGEEITTADLLRVGERIWTAERLFNLNAGFTREDDSLPVRLLREPIVSGPSAGHVVDLDPMLDEYYRCRHWGSDGRPDPRRLVELDLEWAAQV